MKVPKKINQVRRSLMKGLTKNIGKASSQRKYDKESLPEIKKILISRPNGRLGNLLLITPLVQDITDVFPDCKIDILVKGGLAPILFQNYKSVDKIIQLPKKPFSSLGKYIAKWISLRMKKYDLAINVVKDSSSGRLSTQFSNSKIKFYGDNDEKINQNLELHIAKHPSLWLQDVSREDRFSCK